MSEQLPSHLSELRGQRILVTGAAGFIGGHLFRRLASYDLDVLGTVLNNQEADELRGKGFHAKVLDLTDPEPWDDLLAGIDTVFHIAAMFQEVEEGRDAYARVNQHAVLKLAKTAERMGVRRFVHCSTVGVHGHVKEIPATEQTPYNPMDVYHETKLAGEIELLEFARTLPDTGMTVVVNRPAMVYGPHDLRMLKLFRSIDKGQFRMIGSGKTLAHLGFIEDQTESFLLCAVAPRERVHCESFNIASGEPITLNEFARTIASSIGASLPTWHIPVFPVWMAALACELICKPFGIKPPLFRRRVGFFTHDRAFDLSKAQRQLGYESKWDHRRGVAETIAWYRANGLVSGQE